MAPHSAHVPTTSRPCPGHSLALGRPSAPRSGPSLATRWASQNQPTPSRPRRPREMPPPGLIVSMGIEHAEKGKGRGL